MTSTGRPCPTPASAIRDPDGTRARISPSAGPRISSGSKSRPRGTEPRLPAVEGEHRNALVEELRRGGGIGANQITVAAAALCRHHVGHPLIGFVVLLDEAELRRHHRQQRAEVLRVLRAVAPVVRLEVRAAGGRLARPAPRSCPATTAARAGTRASRRIRRSAAAARKTAPSASGGTMNPARSPLMLVTKIVTDPKAIASEAARASGSAGRPRRSR